ncbi:hypothetical protein, partial [Coxiella burnetii]
MAIYDTKVALPSWLVFFMSYSSKRLQLLAQPSFRWYVT